MICRRKRRTPLRFLMKTLQRPLHLSKMRKQRQQVGSFSDAKLHGSCVPSIHAYSWPASLEVCRNTVMRDWTVHRASPRITFVYALSSLLNL